MVVGHQGFDRALEIPRAEMTLVMQLIGVTSVVELGQAGAHALTRVPD